jgi:hypothetical protein
MSFLGADSGPWILMVNLHDPFYIVLFIIFIWLLVTWLISQAGGWAELAHTYRASEPFSGETWSFQSAQMRWLMNYNRALTIGASPAGMYLSIFPLFRVGHPALFIPWQDITIRARKYLWFRIYEFNFREARSVPFRIRESLGKKLEAAAGSQWPANRDSSGGAFSFGADH